MLEQDILRWLILFGREWVDRDTVYETFGWDIIDRQALFKKKWLNHKALKKWDETSHYRLAPRALNKINKVHEVPQS